MKKLLLLFAIAMGTTGLFAQENKSLTMMEGYSHYKSEYGQLEDGSWGYVNTKLEEPEYYGCNFYYYDSENKNTVNTDSYSHYRYTYNADGSIATQESWNTSGAFYKARVSTYEYDADGNNTKIVTLSLDQAGETTATSTQAFEEYENGYYKVLKNIDEQGNVFYEVHYELTFNDAGQLESRIQLTKNYNSTEEVYDQKGLGEFYTYENGLLEEMYTAYYNAAAGEGNEWATKMSTTTYSYNANGTISSRTEHTESRGMISEIEWRYTYSTLDASLIPSNVKAEAVEDNKVKVTWDAVASATSYVVMCDNTIDTVDETEYTTSMLLDGEHQIAVLAIVGGERKNISNFAVVNVKDAGNLPMQNFKVLAAQKADYESYGYVSTYYELSMSWDVPENASDITEYKVYVDFGGSYTPNTSYTLSLTEEEKATTYNNVNTWTTKQGFYWTNLENTEYDPDTYETISLGSGPDCKIWICAVYATGESAPSNVVEVNVYNLAKEESAVETLNVEGNAEVEMYNLAGQRIYTVDSTTPQLYIIKQGDMVKKVIK